MLQTLGVSQRRACRLAHSPRSTVRYRCTKAPDTRLRERIKALADQHRRFGHPRIHALLRREGFGANHKKTHRIYCEERLQVRKRKQKRRTAIARQPMTLPTQVGQRWSMDFMSDQLSDGRRLRVFNVLDDFSKQCHLAMVDTSISGLRVARELDQLIERFGKPQAIVCDNVLYTEVSGVLGIRSRDIANGYVRFIVTQTGFAVKKLVSSIANTRSADCRLHHP